VTDLSDEIENALDSIRVNREFNANDTEESDLHPEKHDDPRISTFRRIWIDSSDENENALDSIRVNRKFDSNEIEESDLHLAKI
jgi:hypothetical protein